MIRKLISLLMLLPSVCFGQSVTSDAFGILPSQQLNEARAAWAGLRTVDGERQIQPSLDEAETSILFVGPKSVVAGNEDAQAATVMFDRFGNMLDDLAVTFVLGQHTTKQGQTAFGIANIVFRPAPVSGLFLAGASAGGVQSARADFRVTAQLDTIAPQLTPWINVPQTDTFTDITTATLTDPFGNLADDGVGLLVLLTDDAGLTTYLPATIRDGAAQTVLLSRDIDAHLTGQIHSPGGSSVPSSFQLQPLGRPGPTPMNIWPLPTIDAVHLQIGPMLTDAGFLLSDGALVQATVTDKDGTVVRSKGWALDGNLALILPLSSSAAPFEVSLVSALGRETLTIELSEPPMGDTVWGEE